MGKRGFADMMDNHASEGDFDSTLGRILRSEQRNEIAHIGCSHGVEQTAAASALPALSMQLND
jgi:hypothetical protein